MLQFFPFSISFLVIINLFLFYPIQNKEHEVYTITGNAQGTTYQITYLQNDEVVVKNQVDSILNKIDSSLSLYKTYSLINQFNKSDSGCEVDAHLIDVVKKSIATYEKTEGVFDITIKPLVQAWGFGVQAVQSIPDSSEILALRKCMGSKMLILNKNILQKSNSCVQIDCNGIAQGYSVDVLSNFLEKNNIQHYLVELGGEIRVKGKNSKNKQWTIGIERPADGADFLPDQQKIYINKGAVTTSGSYRQWRIEGSKKLTHIIDPRTGFPVDNELISVTVIAHDAMSADALDNSLMVMGLQRSFDFLSTMKEVEAFFVYTTADGLIADTATKGFYKFLN
jgi:thiamine biosynthesis lipoprotein